MSDHSHGNLPFSNLTQIGVVVKNMDQTLERLSSLGIGPFEHRAVPSGAKEWYGDAPMHATFKITAAMVGGVEMEFIEPVDGKSPHKDFLNAKGEGIQHLAFSVDNLEEAVEAMKARGAKVQMRADLGKLQVAYIDMGVGGLVFELMQMNKG